MDDQNEKARLHTAGATVTHVSPFDNLPTYKNGNELSPDFISKWVVPYYMKIASYGNSDWVNQIKEIKSGITKDICLSLLGDFNWRTRLTGSYFAAIKGYRELIDIIGVHFLKSEVCCVGHIYALILAFFNDEPCVGYLNRYLDYYLATPALYFDQKSAMEALLYLDNQNKTNHFGKHIDNWNRLQEERSKIEKRRAQELEKLFPELKAAGSIDNKSRSGDLSAIYFDEQIAILHDLSKSGY